MSGTVGTQVNDRARAALRYSDVIVPMKRVERRQVARPLRSGVDEARSA